MPEAAAYDTDSQYIDATSHAMNRTSYDATRVSDSIVRVDGENFSNGETVEVNSEVDLIAAINSAVGTELTEVSESPVIFK